MQTKKLSDTKHKRLGFQK